MNPMAREEIRRSDKARPTCVHAQRDIEESERLRQFGGIVVHDLNNALFALLGRTQLLARKVHEPALVESAKDLHETVKLLESLVAKLQSACPRDHADDERSNLRAAVLLALRNSFGTLPEPLRPGGEHGFDAWLDHSIEHLPRDLFFDGCIAQVASAIAQLVSIHRQRASAPIAACCRVRDDNGDIRFEFYAEDDGGLWEHGCEPPSLLHGTFDLALMPLAAARRAVRDFGGTAVLERAPSGLRSHLSFRVSHGLTLEQHATHDDAHCAPAHTPPKRRVLIADDDPTVRALLIAALESIDDDVETISDPSAILTCPGLDTFDVVILDAGGGGLEALTELRARGCDMPVLVASGDMIEGNFDDATRIVMKPIALDRLDRELTQLAARKRD
jgi:CheY-like chemotaxis protein